MELTGSWLQLPQTLFFLGKLNESNYFVRAPFGFFDFLGFPQGLCIYMICGYVNCYMDICSSMGAYAYSCTTYLSFVGKLKESVDPDLISYVYLNVNMLKCILKYLYVLHMCILKCTLKYTL